MYLRTVKEKYDYLIVGSGLMGATFAHLAHRAGKRCLVLERRPWTGGNVHQQLVEGINVHQYGAHIFHTSDRRVWDFVNGFVPFNRFTNSPLANYRGQLYNLPFNMNTFHQMWGVTTPQQARRIIEEQRRQAGIGEPRNLEEQALSLVGRDIYETLIKEYTEKQWGRPCTELPAFIIRRLPLRFVYDNNYFNDPHQGIPQGGYNMLVEALLQDVECRTGVDFAHSPYREWQEYAHCLFYTGAIDEFFDFRLGHLEWRTVTFRTRIEDTPNYQGNAVVNYTSHEVPYTRVIEHKHFDTFGQDVYSLPRTVVSEEYSTEWKPGMEPYYPVNDERNMQLLARYRAMAQEQEGVVFAGRLAEYRYYDMAPTVGRAMELWAEASR